MDFARETPSGALPEDQTEAILDAHLDRDFRVFPLAEARAVAAEVGSIAARLGVRYPREFVSHVCGRIPGLCVEVKEEVWPRPAAYDTGPFWSFLYALHSRRPQR